MQKRHVLKGLSVAALALALPHSFAQTAPFKIGFIDPLTGAYSAIAQSEVDGAKLATEALNKKGGILGRQVELLVEDSANDVGTGVQNLRVYERRGLVEPARTDGGTRLYSDADIERLRRIAMLLGEGLNLAGIAMVLDLEADNARLRARAGRHADGGQ